MQNKNTHTKKRLDNDLFWSVGIDKLLVDLPGFGAQLGGRLGVLVVLAGKVEGEVFLAVLGLQEYSEDAQAVCMSEQQRFIQTRTQKPLWSLSRTLINQGWCMTFTDLCAPGDSESMPST